MKKFYAFVALVLVMSMLAGCSMIPLGFIGGDDGDDFVVTEAPEKDDTPKETNPPAEEQTDPPATEPPATEPPAEELVQLDINNYQITLTKVGTSSDMKDLTFYRDLPALRSVEGDYYVYTPLSCKGEDLLGKKVHNYEYFGNGITVLYTYSEDAVAPKCELVNVNTGDVLLSDDAVKIDRISDRFYYVIYVTEQTTNKDECFIYFTDSLFSMSPDDDDVLYKGYAMVFDAQEKQFVEGLKVENPGTDISICGELIAEEISYDTYNLYKPDGTVVASELEDIYLGTDTLIEYTSNGCTVYDTQLNKLYFVDDVFPISQEFPEDYTLYYYSDDFFSLRDDDYNYSVVDAEGNEVIPTGLNYISDIWKGYVRATDTDDNEGVYFIDGTVVVPFEYDDVSIDSNLPVFTMTDHEDNEFMYIPGVGTIALEEDLFHGTSGYYRYTEEGNYDDYDYLIYATGEMATFHDASDVSAGLICCEDGIVELIHGTTLLEGDFDYAMSNGEYLYVMEEDTWVAYQITISY